MRTIAPRLLALLALASSSFAVGCGDDAAEAAAPVEDGSAVPTEPGVWQKVELPGTICGNGSQYKFFINDSPSSSGDVMIMLEPGGACWDYDTCSGRASLSAANKDGIPDSHMGLWQIAFPFMRRTEPANPVRDYNMIFIPYCTGDVHIGDVTRTYVDPLGKDPDLVFHHNGYKNILAVADFVAKRYAGAKKLVTTGCSAGGAGALATHYFFRKTLAPEHGYLFDDSGPIFPGSVNSRPLYDQITESWGIGNVLATLPFQVDAKALDTLPIRLADELPDDRIGVTYFLRDHVYSAYSYERFFPTLDEEQRLDLWREDADLMTAAFAAKPNLGYFLPYWRERNDAHCATALDYAGTEIQESNVDLNDFIDNLLDNDAPLKSYRESVQPGEDMPP